MRSSTRAILTGAVSISLPAPRRKGCLNASSSALDQRDSDATSPVLAPLSSRTANSPPVGTLSVSSDDSPAVSVSADGAVWVLST